RGGRLFWPWGSFAVALRLAPRLANLLPRFHRAVKSRPLRAAVENLLCTLARGSGAPFAVRYADGTEWRASDAKPEFTLVFRGARAYRRIALFGHVGLLEAYFDGDVDLEGSLARALAAGLLARTEEPTLLVRLANRWHEFVHSNASWTRAKHNAEFHYALGP